MGDCETGMRMDAWNQESGDASSSIQVNVIIRSSC